VIRNRQRCASSQRCGGGGDMDHDEWGSQGNGMELDGHVVQLEDVAARRLPLDLYDL
jgi:hypothetical protein